MRKLIFALGRLFAIVYPTNIHNKLKGLIEIFITAWKTKGIKHLGAKSKFGRNIHITGLPYIEIGDNVYIGYNTGVTAFCNDGDEGRSRIIIGDNCMFGNDNHLTAVNGIRIGKNLRTGKGVLITDNSHGDAKNPEHLKLHPNERPIVSKGEIIIGDNVWIGEKASIMPGVTLGDNVVVGANSVVTHSFSDNSVIAGVPAKLINI